MTSPPSLTSLAATRLGKLEQAHKFDGFEAWFWEEDIDRLRLEDPVGVPAKHPALAGLTWRRVAKSYGGWWAIDAVGFAMTFVEYVGLERFGGGTRCRVYCGQLSDYMPFEEARERAEETYVEELVRLALMHLEGEAR